MAVENADFRALTISGTVWDIMGGDGESMKTQENEGLVSQSPSTARGRGTRIALVLANLRTKKKQVNGSVTISLIR